MVGADREQARRYEEKLTTQFECLRKAEEVLADLRQTRKAAQDKRIAGVKTTQRL